MKYTDNQQIKQQQQQEIFEKEKQKLNSKKNNEEFKDKEAENTNYSRTPTVETQQSGMSTRNMIGNAGVLGGAIASAALIPFVGWIVALAILYSFKDKFKDKAEEEKLYKDVAQGLTKNGKSEEEAKKIIADLQKEVDQLKEDKDKDKDQEHKDQELIKNISEQFKTEGDAQEFVKKIQQIHEKNKGKNEQFKQDLKKFLEDKKISPESLQVIAKLLDKITDANQKKAINEVIEQLQQNQNKNVAQENNKNESVGQNLGNSQKIYQHNNNNRRNSI